MTVVWEWVATVVYPLLFALLGIYAVMAALGRCVNLSRWQCTVVLALAAVVAGALALTTGICALNIHSYARPVARAASAGIVVVLVVNLVHELKRMRP